MSDVLHPGAPGATARAHALSTLAAASLALAAMAAWAPQAAHAAIIEHADIAGIRTFQDDQNGRVWADLDNYLVEGSQGTERRYNTYGGYISALQNAGFTWATGTPVYGLLNTLPLNAGQFSAYAGVMMSDYGAAIELIRGITNINGPWLGQIGNNASANGWTGTATLSASVLNNPSNSERPNGNIGGVWAYIDNPQAPAAAVPEPGSLVLAGLALALMAGVRRHGTLRV